MRGQNDLHDRLKDIDSESVKPTGTMTSQKVYDICKESVKEYQISLIKFQASGQHGQDIAQFTSNTNVIYLDILCKNFGNAEFTAFCREGNIIENGLDTGDDSIKDEKSEKFRNLQKKAEVKLKHDMISINNKRYQAEKSALQIDAKKNLIMALTSLATNYVLLDTALFKFEESLETAPSDLKRRRIESFTILLKKNDMQRQDLENELRSLNEANEVKLNINDLSRDDDLDTSNVTSSSNASNNDGLDSRNVTTLAAPVERAEPLPVLHTNIYETSQQRLSSTI